jgi:drug/metabolite transporter (DMT)-like permease
VSTIPANPTAQSNAASARQRSVIIVAACTLLGAVAQILIKVGMTPAHLDPAVKGLVPLVLALVTDVPLFAGYACYGLFCVAMVLALREGELSKLFPIIALTYVWVTLLSYWLLKDTPNWYKNAGIAVIVIGVAILGQGGERK